MRGVFGQHLNVDLPTERIKTRTIEPSWCDLYLGGRGIAAHILLDLVPPNTDPLGEENALIFATGPFQETGMAGSGRHVVMAKFPKTESIAGSYAALSTIFGG